MVDARIVLQGRDIVGQETGRWWMLLLKHREKTLRKEEEKKKSKVGQKSGPVSWVSDMHHIRIPPGNLYIKLMRYAQVGPGSCGYWRLPSVRYTDICLKADTCVKCKWSLRLVRHDGVSPLVHLQLTIPSYSISARCT